MKQVKGKKEKGVRCVIRYVAALSCFLFFFSTLGIGQTNGYLLQWNRAKNRSQYVPLGYGLIFDPIANCWKVDTTAIHSGSGGTGASFDTSLDYSPTGRWLFKGSLGVGVPGFKDGVLQIFSASSLDTTFLELLNYTGSHHIVFPAGDSPGSRDSVVYQAGMTQSIINASRDIYFHGISPISITRSGDTLNFSSQDIDSSNFVKTPQLNDTSISIRQAIANKKMLGYEIKEALGVIGHPQAIDLGAYTRWSDSSLTGPYGCVLGMNNYTTWDEVYIVGENNTAIHPGGAEFIFGSGNSVLGGGGVTIGWDNIVDSSLTGEANYDIVIGIGAHVAGKHSMALGYNSLAALPHSTAIGAEAYARDSFQVMLGSLRDTVVAPNVIRAGKFQDLSGNPIGGGAMSGAAIVDSLNTFDDLIFTGQSYIRHSSQFMFYKLGIPTDSNSFADNYEMYYLNGTGFLFNSPINTVWQSEPGYNRFSIYDSTLFHKKIRVIGQVDAQVYYGNGAGLTNLPHDSAFVEKAIQDSLTALNLANLAHVNADNNFSTSQTFQYGLSVNGTAGGTIHFYDAVTGSWDSVKVVNGGLKFCDATGGHTIPNTDMTSWVTNGMLFGLIDSSKIIDMVTVSKLRDSTALLRNMLATRISTEIKRNGNDTLSVYINHMPLSTDTSLSPSRSWSILGIIANSPDTAAVAINDYGYNGRGLTIYQSYSQTVKSPSSTGLDVCAYGGDNTIGTVSAANAGSGLSVPGNSAIGIEGYADDALRLSVGVLGISNPDISIWSIGGLFYSDATYEPLHKWGLWVGDTTGVHGRGGNAKIVDTVFAGKIVTTGTITDVKLQDTTDLAHPKINVIGYYPTWEQGLQNNSTYPVDSIDFSCLTHAVHFTRAWAYTSPAFGDTAALLDSVNDYAEFPNNNDVDSYTFTSACNSHNVIPLVGVGGAGDKTSLDSCTVPSRLDHFVHLLMNLGRKYNYKGFDINWEPFYSSDSVLFTTFCRALHDSIAASNPTWIMTIPISYQSNYSVIVPVQHLFTIAWTQTYDMAGAWLGWENWFNQALTSNGSKFLSTNADLPSIDQWMDGSLKYVDAQITGMGFDLGGSDWHGGSGMQPSGGATFPRQVWTKYNDPDSFYVYAPTVSQDLSYDYIVATYGSGRKYYDANAQQAYFSVDASGSVNDHFVPFTDVTACRAFIKYGRAKGIHNYGVWQLAKNKDNMLLRAIKEEIINPSLY
jgi:hypothetical protein